MREIENIERKKKSLLLTLMQYKFEENVSDLIDRHGFNSMDELDAEIDTRLRQYYEECNIVSDYYDKKLQDS